MTTIGIHIVTDNMADAKEIFDKLAEANVNVNVETTFDFPKDDSNTETNEVTPGEIAGVLTRLSLMNSDELEEKFGSGLDKPYRVLKAKSFEEIRDALQSYSIATSVSIDEAKAAVDYIIKDVSDGGMSHSEMENIFGYHSSTDIFKYRSLDDIVVKLQEAGKIAGGNTDNNVGTEPVTAGQIAGILSTLSTMSEYELEDTFGYEKPYKVIRNLGYENILERINDNTIETGVSTADAKEAVKYIVDDISDGGISKNDMEDVFGYRKSKDVFMNFSLDEIVSKLQDAELI